MVTFGSMNSDQERDAFSQRLRESLARVGKTGYRPSDLAREFNRRYAGEPISLHAARKWLLGSAIPTQEKVRVLARWLGVSPEWLRFGEAPSPNVLVAFEPDSEPYFDFQLMREIAELTPAQQVIVRLLVSKLAELPK